MGRFLDCFFFFYPPMDIYGFFFFSFFGIRISMVFYYQNKAKEIGYRLIAIVPYLSLSSTTETKSKMMERRHAQLKYNKSPLNKIVDHYLGIKETYYHVLLLNKPKISSIDCTRANGPLHSSKA